MEIRQAQYRLIIDDQNGSLQSFSNGVREFIQAGQRPLFTIRFRDEQGKAMDLAAIDARNFAISSERGKDAITVNLNYQEVGGLPIQVRVEVFCPDQSALTEWNFSVDNQTDLIMEWIDFPDVVVPNDLVASGGNSRILWPAQEGTLIEDADMREGKRMLRYKELGYPSKGWGGIYPGPCPTQFMAYYNELGGLYFGAHDPNANVKSIEYRKYDDGVRLQIQSGARCRFFLGDFI